MSVTNVVRRGLASVAVAATSLAVLASACLPGAQASTAASAQAARPAALHVSGHSKLGALGPSFAYDFSEAPNGAVYYSVGSTVYVVKGTALPAPVLTVSGRVLAVAANSADLFVDVRRTVTEYKLSGGAQVQKWTLSGPRAPTSAGLYVVGGRVWAWTDWATDKSGFEFANVYRFTTSAGIVHRISNENAYPADAAANSAGFYFETVRSNSTNGYLVHVTPSGTVHRVTDINVDAPVALAGGRAELLAQHFSGLHQGTYIDSYSAATLAHAYSRHVSASDIDIAGTGAGLLVLACRGGSSCKKATINSVRTSNGTTSATLALHYAVHLIAGPSAAAITFHGGNYYLVRLAG